MNAIRERDPTTREQLRDMWIDSGLTLSQIIELAGLRIDPPGLSRRLSGHTQMSVDEAEAIASAFERELRVVRRRRSA